MRCLIAYLTAVVFAWAGASKWLLGDTLSLFRLIGLDCQDPAWLIWALGGVEILLAVLLVIPASRQAALRASVWFLCVLCVYHLGVGVGLGAPTCACFGVPMSSRVTGALCGLLLLTILATRPWSGASEGSKARRAPSTSLPWS